MRRALLLALVIAGLSAAVLALSFSVSRYNVKGQPYHVSLVDYLYMVSAYAALSLSAHPSALDEGRIRTALARYRRTTHHEVKKVAAADIGRFGSAAIPFLARAAERADPYVLEGVARALERIGGTQILPLLLEIIRRHRLFEDLTPAHLRGQSLSLWHGLVAALGKTGAPEGAERLIQLYDQVKQLNTAWTPTIVSSIADTGHGVPFLIAAARTARSAGELATFIWPLARTRDPQATDFVAGLFARPELALRRSARDALAQAGGPAAVASVLRVLAATRDENLKSWLIQRNLANRDARGNPDAIAELERHLTHPALAWEARYALLRIGTPKAYAALVRQFDRLRPEELIRDMEYANAHSLPLIERYLASPDPRVRAMLLRKLPEMFVPEAAPLVSKAAKDSDLQVREAARAASLYTDRILFWKGLTDLLPASVGPSLFHAMRPTFFGAPLDHMLPLLRAIHAVGTILSALLALALLFGAVKVVEPYRFDLFSAFLLLEGFVGDFLLLESAGNAWTLIVGATACHLALLAGVVCAPRERLPGELAGRFERLMGASIWLAMPLLLAFTTPALAQALRFAFHGSTWSLALLGLFALVTVLVVEQWALRWSLAARSEAAEARLAALFWFLLTALLLVAILDWVSHLRQLGEHDESLVTLIAALPLAWLLLARLHVFKPHAELHAPRELPLLPGGRLIAVHLGRRVALQPSNPSWIGRLVKAAIVLATAIAAAVLAGTKGKALSLLLALLIAPVGAAVATLAIALLAPIWVIHLRDGYARVAASRAGLAFNDTGWRRRLTLPLSLQRRLEADGEEAGSENQHGLRGVEVTWIADVLAAQRAAATARGAA
jgi:hypothetical protein